MANEKIEEAHKNVIGFHMGRCKGKVYKIS